jgi:hypothetical protein
MNVRLVHKYTLQYKSFRFYTVSQFDQAVDIPVEARDVSQNYSDRHCRGKG